MSGLKDFRSIADDAMKDINVTEELKLRTLEKCSKKKILVLNRLLAAAACLVILITVIRLQGIMPFKANTGDKEKSDVNILMSPGDSSGIQTEKGDDSQIITFELNSLKDAGKQFGEAFLEPSFIPYGYSLRSIYASGTKDIVNKIIINYTSHNSSFMIIEEKTFIAGGFVNYKSVEINGSNGYIKPESLNNGSDASSLDSEVHWFVNGIHYSVSGQVTEKNAVEIAKSMK